MDWFLLVETYFVSHRTVGSRQILLNPFLSIQFDIKIKTVVLDLIFIG